MTDKGDRNIQTANYYESIHAGQYVQGNYINMNQDLSQAAAEIQQLLSQLQETGVSPETARNQVATDLACQAQSNPNILVKLVQWGQSLGDAAAKTTVTEAAKEVIKIALRMTGFPLP